MKNILLALVCLIGSFSAACAADYRCDATGGVMYQSQRVIDLPQEQNKLYVTVIGDPASDRTQELTGWFSNHPTLVKVKNATQYSVMDTTSPMYLGRVSQSQAFAPPSLPCIRVQSADGQIIYQVSGNNVPLSAEGLCNQLQTNCFRRVQPSQSNINYHYHFDVPVEKEAKKEVIEDVFKSGSLDIPVWFYCVSAGVCLLTGIGIMFGKEYRKHRRGK